MAKPGKILFARLEAFLAENWPASNLAHGYSEVTLRGPIWRRLIVRGSIHKRLASRTTLLRTMFADAERIWVLTAHKDGRRYVRNAERVASRQQWADPDWNMVYKYTLQVIECAGPDLLCDDLVQGTLCGEGVTAIIEPSRRIGWEPGFADVDAFVHAADVADLEPVMAAITGKWSS